MQPSQPPIISADRLARFVVWLAAVLAWFASGAPCATSAQRRRHQRYAHTTIAKLRRAVCNIILIRAAALLPPSRVRRESTPPGLRTAKRATNRAIGGAWLRRHLNTRGPFAAQVRRLLEALRQYRRLAARLAWAPPPSLDAPQPDRLVHP